MTPKFRDRDTERFANGDFVKAFSGFAAQADRRLDILFSTRSLGALASLRSNHLEQLRGDREGQWSIRINRQYRICFEWPHDETGPVNVEIVDYHEEEERAWPSENDILPILAASSPKSLKNAA